MSKPSGKGKRWLLYLLVPIPLWLGTNFALDFFPEEQKELRREIRSTVEKTFPEQAMEIARSFGLISITDVNPAHKSVVLVHGLDDPGKVWEVLGPELASKGMNVWQMRYPNDQPVVDSAELLNDEMEKLNSSGITEISLVAHSMGGLVSRELLSNPQIAYAQRTTKGVVPRVKNFVMVGTPNQGSELARFRMFSELREQWVNLVENQGNILGGVLDGVGEARFDLLPNSKFLKKLNERPLPEDVRMLIIAGAAKPWDAQQIEQFLNANLDKDYANEILALIKSMGDDLGDGLVTIESTRLAGVEHRIVAGTHLSMIRNISENGSRIPPAVPMIIEFLEQSP